MKVKVFGGRVGFDVEWEEEFVFDSDATYNEIDFVASGVSSDFMTYILGDDADQWDYWYGWEPVEESDF